MRTDILGVGFDDISKLDAADTAMGYAPGGGSYIVTPNPEIVMAARRDETLRDAVNGASLVLPDGIGVVYGARILGTPLSGRVPGIDFAYALFERLRPTGGSVYLLGAKPGVARLAGERLCADYPGLRVAGARDGYFEDSDAVVADINACAPDVVLVCLGSPKQELWMAKYAMQLTARVCVGLGGALDVFSGTVTRAPATFRRLGLEWLYRLITQPSRIGRMMKLPLFIFAAIGERLRKGSRGQ